MKESFASVWKYSLTLFCFWGQNDASAYRGEGVKWRGEGGVVVALQNEFTEIFIYYCLKAFAEKKMSFILTFLQMSNFVKFAILNDITSDAKIVPLVR